MLLALTGCRSMLIFIGVCGVHKLMSRNWRTGEQRESVIYTDSTAQSLSSPPGSFVRVGSRTTSRSRFRCSFVRNTFLRWVVRAFSTSATFEPLGRGRLPGRRLCVLPLVSVLLSGKVNRVCCEIFHVKRCDKVWRMLLSQISMHLWVKFHLHYLQITSCKDYENFS